MTIDVKRERAFDNVKAYIRSAHAMIEKLEAYSEYDELLPVKSMCECASHLIWKMGYKKCPKS